MSILSAPMRKTLALLALSFASTLHAQKSCLRIDLSGELSADAEWHTPIGQGWVFRVIPIQPQSTYSGWDLAVDREPFAGYPDALLLATPPYNSLNEREIAATFGLRAQDALGWNPRTFRFITDPAAFRSAQQLYLQLERTGQLAHPTPAQMSQLLQFQQHSAPGQFRILDAQLTPGTADPRPFAENWVRAFSRTSYTVQPPPDGKSTPGGTLNWIRFSVSLTLPAGWKLPPSIHATRTACGQ
jgi:hypothetical protein